MRNYQLNDGCHVIDHVGKYLSNLIIIAPQSDLWDCQMPEAPETIENLTKVIDWDGNSLSVWRGNFFKTEKGRKAFRVQDDGEHYLIAVSWGGPFKKTRGRPTYKSRYIEKYKWCLYYRYASSNGGGAGNTWIIIPSDLKLSLSEKDVLEII